MEIGRFYQQKCTAERNLNFPCLYSIINSKEKSFNNPFSHCLPPVTYFHAPVCICRMLWAVFQYIDRCLTGKHVILIQPRTTIAKAPHAKKIFRWKKNSTLPKENDSVYKQYFERREFGIRREILGKVNIPPINDVLFLMTHLYLCL